MPHYQTTLALNSLGWVRVPLPSLACTNTPWPNRKQQGSSAEALFSKNLALKTCRLGLDDLTPTACTNAPWPQRQAAGLECLTTKNAGPERHPLSQGAAATT